MRFTIRMAAASVVGLAVSFLAAANGLAAAQHSRMVILYRFSGGADGRLPAGSLIADQVGNLYGTTELGGQGAGVVFELSPGKARKSGWTETVLHGFSGPDGANPLGGLAIDPQGNLYGTAFSDTVRAGGVVFELSPGGNNWTFTQLYGFDSQDSPNGANPNGGLIRDASGNLYGTTQYGGRRCYCGVVFEVSPLEGGGWSEAALYGFRNKPDGAYPYAGITADSSGDFFGTTSAGGDGHCGDGEGDPSGCGTVFSLTSSKSGWSDAILRDFQRGEPNFPATPLTLGGDGALYGTVGNDVYRLVRDGNAWTEQVLYAFKNGKDDKVASSGVVFDTEGNLYGMTATYGPPGSATVYELSPPAGRGGPWTKTTLAKFATGSDVGVTGGNLLLGADGTIYGSVGSDPGYVFAIKR